MPTKEIPKWRDRFDVLAPEDHDQLEANAAIHEFRGGATKDDAEVRAHKDYLQTHAVTAAAHHYLGMRAALAVNHQAAAKQHGAAYELAMKHLGYSHLTTPPKDVLDRAKDIEKNPYKFSPHPADSFFAPEIPQAPKLTAQQRTLELVDKLKSLRAKV
jgi:hypothetical protein